MRTIHNRIKKDCRNSNGDEVIDLEDTAFVCDLHFRQSPYIDRVIFHFGK